MEEIVEIECPRCHKTRIICELDGFLGPKITRIGFHHPINRDYQICENCRFIISGFFVASRLLEAWGDEYHWLMRYKGL